MKMHRKTAIKILFVIYCVVMMQLLFFRFPSTRAMPYWQIIRKNINIIPLATIRDQIYLILHETNHITVHYAYLNLFGNIIVFIPFGIFLPLLGNKTKKPGWVLFIAFAVFLAVEAVQLFSLTGRADIDDVLLNLLGCLFGYCLWRTGNALHKRRLSK
jgi:teicoplanin resistance protein